MNYFTVALIIFAMSATLRISEGLIINRVLKKLTAQELMQISYTPHEERLSKDLLLILIFSLVPLLRFIMLGAHIFAVITLLILDSAEIEK